MAKKPTYKEIEQAKQILDLAGYSVENIWSVPDVKGLYKCTDEQAKDVLKGALKNDATMEQIWLAINVHAENEGLEKISK